MRWEAELGDSGVQCTAAGTSRRDATSQGERGSLILEIALISTNALYICTIVSTLHMHVHMVTHMYAHKYTKAHHHIETLSHPVDNRMAIIKKTKVAKC